MGILVLTVVTGMIITHQTRESVRPTQSKKVAATIFPLYDITKNIAGGEFEVVLMLPSGASPHTFDPQPSLLKELSGVQTVFAIGQGLDDWSHNLAESVGADVVRVDTGISLRATVDDHEEHEHDDQHEEDGHGHDEEHEGHNHGPIDPHYWLSVHNAQQITTNIADVLSELDPENATRYQANANAYLEQLEILEEELEGQTASISNPNIISLHDAWYYFADEFGLNIVGTFEPSAGKNPTPQYLETLEEEVEEHDVSILFLEPQLSTDSIKAFATDHNLGFATIDPLGGVEGRSSYIELMRYNVQAVVDTLK